MSKKYSQYKTEEELKAEEEKVKTTHIKGDFIIEPDGRYGMYRIRHEKNGVKMPRELSGGYTSRDAARKAIHTYMKDQKVHYSIRDEIHAAKQREIAETKARQKEEQERKDKQSERDTDAINKFMQANGIVKEEAKEE